MAVYVIFVDFYKCRVNLCHYEKRTYYLSHQENVWDKRKDNQPKLNGPGNDSINQ